LPLVACCRPDLLLLLLMVTQHIHTALRQCQRPAREYAGRQVVGMDLHRQRSVLVRMTEDGRKLGTARITNRGLRSSCKDQVHAVLAKLGLAVTCSDLFGACGSAWMDGLRLPQPYAGKVTSLRQLIGELSTEITMLSEVIADLLAGHAGYRVIQRLPGIGPVLAAVIIAEIGDVTRFRTAAQLASWATPK
jgi:transposase